jgi:ribosomal protein S18 acetylase RimI-like enzyme
MKNLIQLFNKLTKKGKREYLDYLKEELGYDTDEEVKKNHIIDSNHIQINYDNNPAGFMNYKFVCYIADMDVLEDYGRKGLGSEMLKHLEKILKKKKISTIESDVACDNKKAIDFCKKNGFKIIAKRIKDSRFKMSKEI